MFIHLAPWVLMQSALAAMLVVTLNIHPNIHRLAGMRDAGRYAYASASGDVLHSASDPSPTALKIVVQSNPAFSSTRPAIVGHGQVITYTLVVTNSSRVTHTQLVLTDVVPLGSTAITPTVSPSPARAPHNGVGPWVWLISELEPGSTFTVSHAVRVNALITVTAIVNVAEIRSDQTTPITSNVTVHVFGGPPGPPVEQWRYYGPIAGRS